MTEPFEQYEQYRTDALLGIMKAAYELQQLIGNNDNEMTISKCLKIVLKDIKALLVVNDQYSEIHIKRGKIK